MTLNITAVMSQWLQVQMERVHTAIPGTIESYDPETRLAVITPAINYRSAQGAVVPYKPIAGVPVQFPSGANWQIHGELVKGDSGLLIISEASLGSWLESDGKTVTPNEFDRFCLEDSLFIPGVWPTKLAPKGAPSKGLWIQYKDSSIEFKSDGGLKITGDVEVVGNIKATLQVSAMSLLPATEIKLSTHLHGTGVGPSTPPTPGT